MGDTEAIDLGQLLRSVKQMEKLREKKLGLQQSVATPQVVSKS